MVKTIYQKELTQMSHSLKFVLLLVVTFLVVPVSVYVGSISYSNKATEYPYALQKYEKENRENRVNPAQFRAMGFVEPSVLGVFSKGASELIPTWFFVSRDHGIEYPSLSMTEGPVASIMGQIDFVFCVYALMSLIALLFAAESVAKEYEKGTLSILLTYPIKRIDILLGKFCAIMTVVLIPLALSVLLSVFFLLAVTNVPLLSEDALLRLGTLLLTSSAYLALWVLIGMVLSVLLKDSGRSQIVAVAFWSILILVMPRATWLVASAIRPIPPLSKVEVEKQQRTEAFRAEKESILRSIWNDPKYAELRPVKLEQVQEKEMRANREVEENFAQSVRHQSSLAISLAEVFFPSQFLIMANEICGNGLQQVDRLRGQMVVYKAQLDHDLFSKAQTDNVKGLGMRMSWAMLDASDAPSFKSKEGKFADYRWSILLNLLLLLGEAIALSVVLVASFNRLDMGAANV